MAKTGSGAAPAPPADICRPRGGRSTPRVAGPPSPTLRYAYELSARSPTRLSATVSAPSSSRRGELSGNLPRARPTRSSCPIGAPVCRRCRRASRRRCSASPTGARLGRPAKAPARAAPARCEHASQRGATSERVRGAARLFAAAAPRLLDGSAAHVDQRCLSLEHGRLHRMVVKPHELLLLLRQVVAAPSVSLKSIIHPTQVGSASLYGGDQLQRCTHLRGRPAACTPPCIVG